MSSDTVIILIFLYLMNVILGLIPMMIVDMKNLDIKYNINTDNIISILGGLVYWVIYFIYRLIKLPKVLKQKNRLKAMKEYEEMKIEALRFSGDNMKYELRSLIIECKDILYKITQNKYKDINLAHNNKSEKLFISTILKIKEIYKQYAGKSIDEVSDKVEETLNKLRDMLNSELKKYEEEYNNIIKQDKINIKKELDNINKEMDYYVEFNEKYYK